MTITRRHARAFAAFTLIGILAAGLIYRRYRHEHDPLTLLVAAAPPERAIEGRLTGGFRYTPASRTRRAAPRANPALAIAAIEAERIATESPSPSTLATLGKALLVIGDDDRAVQVLERAARQSPLEGAMWSDLSAAYLSRARAGFPIDGIRALDAALKSAALAPSLPEARFNAALLLTRHHLTVEADEAWAHYARVERDAAWRTGSSEQRPARSMGTSWLDLRSRLLGARDAEAESEALTRFPHAVRELVEEVLIPEWAGSWEHNRERACARLLQARELSQGVRARGGDSLAHEMVGALLRSGACPSPGSYLRAGLLAYADGRARMERADFDGALSVFQIADSALTRAGSPMASWAHLHLAYARYQAGDLERALVGARRVEVEARRARHPALLARALFVSGLALRDSGRTDEALRVCAESIEHSERAGETFHARATARAAADIARTAGDDGESWRLMVRSLEAVDEEPSAVRRYLSYFNAALFARSSGYLHAALVFQNAAVRAAHDCAETGAPAQAFGQRAYVQFLLDRPRDASNDLRRARAALDDFHGSPRTYYHAELDTIDAALRLSTDPARARALLEGAASVFARAAPEQVPDAYVALGRAALRLGDGSGAVRALQDGIAFFEDRRGRISDEEARIAFFGTARDLYHDLIMLLLASNAEFEAFAYADRVRGRALSEVAGRDMRDVPATPTPELLTRALGNGAAFVSYLAVEGRVISWTIGPGGIAVERASIPAEALEALIRQLRSPLVTAAEEEISAATLHTYLIRPLQKHLGNAKVLYLSADGPLHGVPFGQLRDASTGRRLIEDVTIVMVPSARWLVDKLQSGASRRPSLDILAIGNPALPQGPDALPPLPAAQEEAVRAARMYRSSRMLAGAAATKRDVLRLAPGARIIHFAGHAIQNGAAPALSHLMLAPDPPDTDGRLRARDIAAMRLDAAGLVILGACSTAKGVVRFGEGPLTLARPFLAAGAGSVVASLWDVEDQPTAKLLTHLHRALRDGLRPAEALRAAQLEMLRSADVFDRRPRHWSAFAIFGSNAHVFAPPPSHPGETHE